MKITPKIMISIKAKTNTSKQLHSIKNTYLHTQTANTKGKDILKHYNLKLMLKIQILRNIKKTYTISNMNIKSL